MYIEQIEKLMERNPQACDDIVEYAAALTRYVNSVADHEFGIMGAGIRLSAGYMEQPDYIACLERLNDQRNRAHDNACRACESLNNMAQRSGLRNIFDFNPQKLPDKTGRIVYSQENHYQASGFCAEFINESYEKGTLRNQENLFDVVAEHASEEKYNPLTKDTLSHAIQEYKAVGVPEHEVGSLLDSGKPALLQLRDGTCLELQCMNKYKEYDAAVSGSVPKGTAGIYFDTQLKNGASGKEIPRSIIQDVVKEHGGCVLITGRQLAGLEKTMFEKGQAASFSKACYQEER